MLDPLTQLMPSRQLDANPTRDRQPSPPTLREDLARARGASLDLRLSAALRGAARGFGYDAAELWLLDEATRRLTRRVAWGAGVTDTAPRQLEEADADLAALAGSAVVLATRAEARDWPLPRSSNAAACLPVSSDRMIHGVLWFYADSDRDMTDEQLEVLEVVAGRLAVELEREELLGLL